MQLSEDQPNKCLHILNIIFGKDLSVTPTLFITRCCPKCIVNLNFSLRFCKDKSFTRR